ncbi:MAG: AAA family ATPase [Patescibacteria group bacterium]|jgi:gluconokinase
MNQALIVLMGLPGSGKSYVAEYIHKKYGFVLLSGEEITTQMFGTEKVSGKQYAEVYKSIRQKASELLSHGNSVIIDGTNLKHEFRQQIYNEVKCDSTLLIYLKVDDDTALDRISKRNNSCSPETYKKFKNQIEEPFPEENAFMIISDSYLLKNVDNILEA